MAKDLLNHIEGYAVADHLGSKGMAERMDA